MPKLTVRKSTRPPKPTRSPTMPSKSTSSSKPKVKYVKTSGFIHPDDHVVEDENDSEQEEEIQEVHRAVKDISHEIFTLKYSCLLRSNIVLRTQTMCILENFHIDNLQYRRSESWIKRQKRPKLTLNGRQCKLLSLQSKHGLLTML